MNSPDQRTSNPASKSIGDSESAETVLGSGCHLRGEVKFEQRTVVHGSIEGRIVADAELTIGEQAVIAADISGTSVAIAGRVKGDIDCTTRLALHSGACVTGNISTPALIIDDGVVFEGACSMQDASGSQQSAASNSGSDRLRGNA